MEPENGGPLEKEIPKLETIISRFHVKYTLDLPPHPVTVTNEGL